MQTHFLPDQIVDAYLTDFAARLIDDPACRPELWVSIGLSGRVILQRLLRLQPQLKAPALAANFDRVRNAVVFNGGTAAADVPGKRVWVIDSSVHSGGSMAAIVKEVAGHTPASVSSYSLTIKRSARFVPSLWGVTINDHDRVYFLLDRMPNNRLSRRASHTHLRLLTYADLKLPAVISGRKSIDRICWADRYYDAANSERERRTYVLEDGVRPVGYLTVARFGRATLRVDEVVVGERDQGKGHASTLLRWAETCARQQDCELLDMWAVDDKVAVYENADYKKTQPEETMDLDGEIYHRMQKRLLHHLKPKDDDSSTAS